MLELPIVWTLPTGLTVKQNYLATKSTSITPFIHSKVKLNLKTTDKEKINKEKQIRALMPNLIHSLDASSMSLLHKQFSQQFKGHAQLFAIHGCFGTTCDKVFVLKTLLASIYTDMYTSDQYLIKFDENILESIKDKTHYTFDKEKRTIHFDNSVYEIHDIQWVINKKLVTPKQVKAIDMQNILI